MKGIHPSIANAFRRIIISEVTTMAVEKVRLYNNTSLLQDEFLAHRLGLIPIRADPVCFSMKTQDAHKKKKNDADSFDDDPKDTLLFTLKVRCPPKKESSPKKKTKEAAPAADGMIDVPDGRVLSKHMIWMPLEGQRELFKDDPPRVVDDDILIAKLSHRQEIDIIMQVVKGVGGDHAKFSPVATASYRLLPKITLLNTVSGEAAERLQKSFSPGVIGIHKKGHAFVVDARKDSLSRNFFRHPDLKDAVQLSLIKDHFLFTVESTGARSPVSIVEESIDILAFKCEKFIQEIKNLKERK